MIPGFEARLPRQRKLHAAAREFYDACFDAGGKKNRHFRGTILCGNVKHKLLINLGNAVAVVADSTWAAFQASRELNGNIQWNIPASAAAINTPRIFSQAQQLIHTASVQIAAAERSIAQSENLLSLLQGSVPSPQARGRKLEEIQMPAQLPPGMPSVLLERRPDIREAEQNLVAANAQIGAARALYFPQLSLSAFVGGQSRRLFDLASSPGRVYTVAPTAIQSVFNAGQIRNQVRFSEAQQRELLIAYQRSIYSALREVSDALISFDKLREQRAQEEQLVRTLEDTMRLSELRYRGGLDSYLQVLDAQRNLFAGQLSLAQLRLQERVSVVQLYRALGGGWS